MVVKISVGSSSDSVTDLFTSVWAAVRCFIGYVYAGVWGPGKLEMFEVGWMVVKLYVGCSSDGVTDLYTGMAMFEVGWVVVKLSVGSSLEGKITNPIGLKSVDGSIIFCCISGVAMDNSHPCCCKRFTLNSSRWYFLNISSLAMTGRRGAGSGVVLMITTELNLCSDIPFSSERYHAEQAKEGTSSVSSTLHIAISPPQRISPPLWKPKPL